MPIHFDEIQAFHNRPGIEGSQQLQGYVPCKRRNYTGHERPEDCGPVIAASGVTAATGCDFGQQGESSLSGIPATLLQKLKPYLGKRKAIAMAALNAAPLTLAKTEADILDRVILTKYANLAAKRYDRDAWAGAFEALPWQAQAVIDSILFQRGSGSPKDYPNTWQALVRRDWATASAKLCNATLWKNFQTRRRLEGELLREIA